MKAHFHKIKKSYVLPLSIIVLFGALSNTARAQENSQATVTNQVWTDFNILWKLSERLDLRGKIGTKEIFPDSWFKVYTSAEVAYRLPKFIFPEVIRMERVYAGLDFYNIFYTEETNILELSPYQGYSLFYPNGQRLAIKHNIELGERFQWGSEGDSFTFGLKASYELLLTLKFQGDLWEHGKGLFLTASAKLWWNLIAASVYNDVMRITPGLGYSINPKWKTAFFIGYNYTRNLSIDEFQTNNIIYRLRVYYSLN